MGVLIVNKRQFSYTCTVSVISRRTLLTAANCIFARKPTELQVYLDRNDRTQDAVEPLAISSIKTFFGYTDSLEAVNDIGLLIVTEPLVYSRYIHPLCLWTSDMDAAETKGDEGMVAVWENYSTGGKTRVQKLLNVNILSQSQCEGTVGNFTNNGTMCAENSGTEGPCAGDLGAALMIKRNSSWFIRGIVSLIPGKESNCDPRKPVVYTDVSKYLKWINAEMVV
ncbi:hypothetical protein KR018_001356 [Drosophila ironensis]|nr:hypothetical protein KR018_001356 [Drosophila ironensis]